jgi:hypothetical protein
MKTWTIQRISRIVIYLALLITFVIYGYISNPAVTLPMCFADPLKYDGTLLEIGNEIMVDKLTLYGFTIRQHGITAEVWGDNNGVRENEYIVLKAVFHQGPWLELEEFHISKKRRTKIYISIFPALFVIVFVLTNLRYSRQGLGWKHA